jgi:hypothetical protein
VVSAGVPDPGEWERANAPRYVPGSPVGHYESWYVRANHPYRPLACWIRATVTSPAGRACDAVGESWFVLFDGETGRHEVARHRWPAGDCELGGHPWRARIGGTLMTAGRATGSLAGDPRVGWDLRWTAGGPPAYLLARARYAGRFPPAKSLVPDPLLRLDGELVAGERRIEVDGWAGSQNHNWGVRHTDRYLFGQVAGFDGAPDSGLEVVSATTRLGPLRTPLTTLLVLRHDGTEYALTSIRQGLRARARVTAAAWEFTSTDARVRVHGRLVAPEGSQVALAYDDPPGGTKYCVNTALARCEVTVRDRATGRTTTLHSAHGAMLESLSGTLDPRVPLRA